MQPIETLSSPQKVTMRSSIGLGTTDAVQFAALTSTRGTAGVGTVSVFAQFVTGTGTDFLSRFVVGDSITINTVNGYETRVIGLIGSDTEMTTFPFSWPSASGAEAYTHTTASAVMNPSGAITGRTGVFSGPVSGTIGTFTGIVAVGGTNTWNGSTFSGAQAFSGSVSVTDATASTTTTTGALKVTGGLGVGGAINAGSQVAATRGTAGVGTVTITGGALTTVTGTSTDFLTRFIVGDSIIVTTTSGSETEVISAIASNTSMTTSAFTGTATGAAYTHATASAVMNPSGAVSGTTGTFSGPVSGTTGTFTTLSLTATGASLTCAGSVTGTQGFSIGNSASISTLGASPAALRMSSSAPHFRFDHNYVAAGGSVSLASLTASGTVKAGGYTVATLPTPAVGMSCYVTDATATTFYSIVAGGGSNVVPVFYNGTNWVIA